MAYKYEKNYAGGQDIVIDGWERGIAPSPVAGMSDIRGCDIDSIPGTIMARGAVTGTTKLNGTNIFTYTSTFTADAGTDNLNMNTGVPTSFFGVTFTNSGGSLPAGLTAGTFYYLVSSGTTTKVATSIQNAYAGTYVNITSAGTGTHTATAISMGVIKSTAVQWQQGNNAGQSVSVLYALDNVGLLWAYNYMVDNQWTLLINNVFSFPNGIAIYQNWLFIFSANKISVYGKLTGAISAHTMYANWQTTAGYSSFDQLRKTLIGQDNVLYWTDYALDPSGERLGYIGSLRTLPGQVLFADTGNPTTSSATTNYTYNNNSLDLPSGEQPVDLAELNSKLIIACSKSSNFSQSANSISKLYSWDRTSPSFDYPIEISIIRINHIKNINNIIYIFGGRAGVVYKTDMSSVQEAFTIPKQIFNLNSGTTYYEGDPLNSTNSYLTSAYNDNGISFGYNSLLHNKKIYFIVSYLSMTGVFEYNIVTGALDVAATPLLGAGTSSTDVVSLTTLALSPFNTTTTEGYYLLMFGQYYNGSTSYFVDGLILNGKNNTANSYASYVVTDLISVGTKNNKKTFQQLEYTLDKKMDTGSGLKIYYRTGVGDTWTALSTEDYATYGAITSRALSFPVTTTEFIQIKVELEFNTRLRQIRLR